jgi:hypothetical protein
VEIALTNNRIRGFCYAVLFVMVAIDQACVGAALFLVLMQIVEG